MSPKTPSARKFFPEFMKVGGAKAGKTGYLL
jgi:hypothetical protein